MFAALVLAVGQRGKSTANWLAGDKEHKRAQISLDLLTSCKPPRCCKRRMAHEKPPDISNYSDQLLTVSIKRATVRSSFSRVVRSDLIVIVFRRTLGRNR